MRNILAASFNQVGRGRIVFASALLGIAWLIGGEISRSNLLDSTFYFTCITFLTVVWFWTSSGSESIERQAKPVSGLDHFYIKHTGRSECLPSSIVLYLRAAGNYTELVCDDGRTVLHHQRLGQIMEQPPEGFLRVHRSHAINLSRAQGLKSLEGSRYFAELEGGHKVPVSRYQVREIRDFLKYKIQR